MRIILHLITIYLWRTVLLGNKYTQYFIIAHDYFYELNADFSDCFYQDVSTMISMSLKIISNVFTAIFYCEDIKIDVDLKVDYKQKTKEHTSHQQQHKKNHSTLWGLQIECGFLRLLLQRDGIIEKLDGCTIDYNWLKKVKIPQKPLH